VQSSKKYESGAKLLKEWRKAGNLENAESIYGWQIDSYQDNTKIRRSFLWKRNYEGHKFHLVNWENAIMLKQQADKESKIQGSKTRVC
ncbi:hypothetical protein H5410_055593, partial [Solanum commersonii]